MALVGEHLPAVVHGDGVREPPVLRQLRRLVDERVEIVEHARVVEERVGAEVVVVRRPDHEVVAINGEAVARPRRRAVAVRAAQQGDRPVGLAQEGRAHGRRGRVAAVAGDRARAAQAPREAVGCAVGDGPEVLHHAALPEERVLLARGRLRDARYLTRVVDGGRLAIHAAERAQVGHLPVLVEERALLGGAVLRKRHPADNLRVRAPVVDGDRLRIPHVERAEVELRELAVAPHDGALLLLGRGPRRADDLAQVVDPVRLPLADLGRLPALVEEGFTLNRIVLRAVEGGADHRVAVVEGARDEPLGVARQRDARGLEHRHEGVGPRQRDVEAALGLAAVHGDEVGRALRHLDVLAVQAALGQREAAAADAGELAHLRTRVDRDAVERVGADAHGAHAALGGRPAIPDRRLGRVSGVRRLAVL